MNGELLLGPEPLSADHRVDEFDCGVEALNDYLTRQALADQRAEKTRTYVVCEDHRVVAYFSLAAGIVEPESATKRLAYGQGRQAIPVILLARLAVDEGWQGRHIGEAIVVEALGRATHAADTIGARAVLAHCKNYGVRGFYLRYGFEPSPTDPLHVMMLMKDIRKTLRGM